MLKLLERDGSLKSMDSLEREIFVEALDYYGGCVVTVVEHLKMARATFYRRLGVHGIDPKDFRDKK